MVVSPVTHKPAKLLESIPVSLIKERYNSELGIDVTKYFDNIQQVELYECNQTGYRFYYPFGLAGDGAFYEQLEKYDWYYSEWKWDYSTAFPHIPVQSKVLDVGCGYGNFLMQLKNKKNCDCTGLELNDHAVEVGAQRGIKIYNETIQAHAEKNAEQYNAVCLFQVLEHIADIDSFLTAALKCLKKGGKLFICVPNNNPYFYQYEKYHSLNMPPHHMGLWNKVAFDSLINCYPLQVENIIEERLDRYRFFTGLYITGNSKPGTLKRLLYTSIKPLFLIYFLLNRMNIKAGSILAVYKKI